MLRCYFAQNLELMKFEGSKKMKRRNRQTKVETVRRTLESECECGAESMAE